MTLQERKQALRTKIGEQLREMSPEERARESRLIRRGIADSAEWKGTPTVLGFLPMADEADVEPLLAEAVKAGKRLGLPRLGGAELRFSGVATVTPESFRRNRELGFREPASEGDEISLSRESPALILIPGRAFDSAGGRLGRGGGYYDRFLGTISLFRSRGRVGLSPFDAASSTSQIILLGVAFSVQLIDEVPVNHRDVPMDLVATPEGIIDCRLFSQTP